MEEESHSPPPPSKHLRRTDVNKDDNDVDDENGLLELNLFVLLPEEMMVNIFCNYLDVQDLVQRIKPVCQQWQHLAMTAIDGKGIGTTRKAFETNQELQDAVKQYCPLPQGANDRNTTTSQQYCDQEIAENIACTYGWPINKWDVSQIKDFSRVFYGGAKRYNRRIGMYDYVDGVSFFNEDISLWNVSKATTMADMFYQAEQFNQNLSTWNVSNVTNMSRMFGRTMKFNINICLWDVYRMSLI